MFLRIRIDITDIDIDEVSHLCLGGNVTVQPPLRFAVRLCLPLIPRRDQGMETVASRGRSRDEPPTIISRGPEALTHLPSALDQY